MSIGDRGDYNRSLVETMILLPMIVTGIVIVVHNSIALAFSLAGIVAGVQFRNALKSLGDAFSYCFRPAPVFLRDRNNQTRIRGHGRV